MRPIEHVRAVAEEIEATDLSRRIALEDGPYEVRALGASFDSMLDRLERAAASQGELIDEASHELRTPLSVLIANADVLLTHPAPTAELYRRGLERSRSTADKMSRSIDDLLLAARRRARTVDRRPSDLALILREVIDASAPLAEARNVEVVLSGSSRAECSVDRVTVERALSNLLDNAIKHSPEGSEVRIDLEATDRAIVATVTDRGKGIPQSSQPHVFDRLWRGEGPGAGSGIGLTIARQVALAHGGSLSLVSPGPTGDGSVFRFSIPM